MNPHRALALRRLFAFALDWLLIALWGGAIFAAVMLATDGAPPNPGDPWRAQGIGFLTMTLPVTLYFALCESSRWRASVGKRVLGLVVSGERGERLSFGAALLRNAVKLAPWELGHGVAQQAIFSGEGGFAAWVWAPAALAFLGPLAWIAGILMTGRAPHDYVARAWVGRSSDQRPASGPSAPPNP